MMLSWNIFLSFIWLACWGDTSFLQFFVGFFLGFAFLFFIESTGFMGNSGYTKKVIAVLDLIWFFCKELWKANVRVAIDLIRMSPKLTPAIVAVPLELQSAWAITTMANMITLTPGTLSLDLNEDNSIIYIHTMYLDNGDKEAFIKEIKEGFEARILKLERNEVEVGTT